MARHCEGCPEISCHEGAAWSLVARPCQVAHNSWRTLVAIITKSRTRLQASMIQQDRNVKVAGNILRYQIKSRSNHAEVVKWLCWAPTSECSSAVVSAMS